MGLTYDQISAITRKKFIPKVVDNIFDSDPLLQRMKKNGSYESVDGGTQIIAPLNYALNSAGGWFSGTETLQTNDNDVISGADYAWKQLYENITISRKDELKNSGDSAVVKFVKAKVMIAEKTMEDRMGDGLYHDGSNSKSIIGLRTIVNQDETVGGIAQGTYSWWQSAVEDTTTTELSISLMNQTVSSLRINSDKPSVIMSAQNVYDLYYNLLQPQQRFQDAQTAKGGFSSLMFNGIPVIDGAKVPANHMFFLNEKYIKLWYHKDENFRFEDFKRPVNQAVKSAKLYWMGAMGSDNIRMQGALKAITS